MISGDVREDPLLAIVHMLEDINQRFKEQPPNARTFVTEQLKHTADSLVKVLENSVIPETMNYKLRVRLYLLEPQLVFNLRPRLDQLLR